MGDIPVTLDELFQQYPFGLMLVDGELVLHMEGYPDKPTDAEFYTFIDSLETNKALKEFKGWREAGYEIATAFGYTWFSVLEQWFAGGVADYQIVEPAEEPRSKWRIL
jgi:hypothetical protein